MYSLPLVPQGPDCPVIPFFIMTTSAELAAQYARLIPHFNALARLPRSELAKGLKVATLRSRKFAALMTCQMDVHALLRGNDGHQGYYPTWYVFVVALSDELLIIVLNIGLTYGLS